MSGPFGSSQWMYSSGGFYPYEIEQSLRFNDDDSAYLSRTPASAGNRKTWTWSGWVKLGNLGANRILFCSDATNSTSESRIGFNLQDELVVIYYRASSTEIGYRYTTPVFRDPSAHYHVLVAVDTTQATPADRCKVYFNGSEVTSFRLSGDANQSTDTSMNNTVVHQIGAQTARSWYFDGYMAEVNFIDGLALDPTSFGEFKSDIWVPKAYSGSYGTNGFYLSFADSAAIGDDLSGNTNDWTANNLVASDVMPDSPTNNFCTMSPLWKSSNTVLENGNLYLPSASYYSNAVGTMGVSSGKWYFEARVGNNFGSYYEFGIIATDDNTFINNVSSGLRGNVTWHQLDTIYSNGTLITNPTSPNLYNTSTKIIGCAIDLDNNKVYFHGNGTWTDSSDPDTDTGGTTIAAAIQGKTFVPLVGTNNVSATPNTWLNFGQDGSFSGTETAQGNTDDNGQGDFYYAPPSGYLALCTANLPDPAIDPAVDDVPADYFNTVLYTGNGTSQSITGVGFQPDFSWFKNRGASEAHRLADAVRGAGQVLYSNLTNAEATEATGLLSFDTDGFSLGSGTPNTSTATYVAWNWLAGNGTSSNTDGTITSTVSVNQKAGFSVVSYTGTGANATVGHGLGAEPDMLIVKDRDATQDWVVYHSANTSAPETDRLLLNSTGATVDNSAIWNDTAPTSSAFSIGTSIGTNANGNDYIAYCFAEVEGFSKFGSYTGNGSTDGPFVFCGFRPAFVMVKRTDSTSSWRMWDDARRPNNVADATLLANGSDAELTGSNENLDILSNGFKLRNLDSAQNASGGTYIFMAFAETPFKYSLAR